MEFQLMMCNHVFFYVKLYAGPFFLLASLDDLSNSFLHAYKHDLSSS